MTEFGTLPALAQRASALRPSPVRSVWDLSMEPGMISLAGGNPDLAGLPLEWLGERANRLIAGHGGTVLQYGAGAGVAELREQIAALVADCGIVVNADDVLITAGSQMGLELVTSLFCDPGDVVLAEGPTYVGAIGMFRGLQADVVHVECDEHGLIPEAVAATIARVQAEGRTIKMLYTIPNFANPSGITLAEDRRRTIAAMCREAGIALIEDDPYGRIHFGQAAPPAIRSIDDQVIYLGSMSKIFSPGLRLGWVIAPRAISARLQLASEATTIHASILSQHIGAAYLRSGDWRTHLDAAIERYSERASAMLAALEAHMPAGTTWTTPTGGFFVWVTLPEGCSADLVFDAAVTEHVVFVKGSAFFANDNGANNIRLSFSLETPEHITEGVARIGRAIRHVQAQA